MRINLIPPELRPADASPLPYFVLAGLATVMCLWLLGQFAAASGARKQRRQYAAELGEKSKDLKASKDCEKALARARQERDQLRLKAAFVTVLSRQGFRYAEVLRALAKTTPEQLRLTEASLDPGQGAAMLLGYGNQEGGDLEVASFLRALNDNATIRQAFRSVTLDFCDSRKQGGCAVKKFSISMPFRQRRACRPAAPD